MLHFAPRYGIISPCLNWGPLRPRALRVPRPVNDNRAVRARPACGGAGSAANDSAAQDEALLAAALRLFAAHGISAAERACEAAQIATDSGDATSAEWWIAVCAMLDGPMAKAAQRAYAARTGSQG